MRTLLATFVLTLLTMSAYAQGGKIAFTKTIHDFGNIQEGTIATYTFEFTNEGKRPLRLLGVQPSCGCTTPEYSKEPVEPGKKGMIKVAYDSNGRPGIIDKSIAVSTDGDPNFVNLFIKGAVLNDKVKGPDITQIGNLMLNEGSIDAKTVAIGSNFSHSIEYQVTGTKGIKIVGIEAPDDIEVKYFQFTAQPQEIFQFTVYFKPAENRRPGTFNDKITIITDDTVMPRKTVFISGIITPSVKNN